ncbi:MAG: YcjF family protein, partial [Coleofasciculus sp. C2-GNP5-27]
AQQLIWGTTLRSAISLKAEAKTALNQARRDRALPLIEQYQWIAAATAFANPVPALDLLATAAISSQLVIELAGIYQQKFSLSQAQLAAKTLASLMVKLGLVELSTQTIGGILKSNAFTYIAGGAVQGVSAAYLTRLAGLSLIEYFQDQEISEPTATDQPLNLDRLKEKLQTVFQQNQRTAFLQG